jgi:microcystin-dependent protein
VIPTSNHNQALSGDTLYSAFLNHEWREIVLPFIIAGMDKIADSIDDETERQNFEVLYGALIDDFYNEDSMDGTPVGTIAWYIGVTASIPVKWLKCEGQVLAKASYPELTDILDPPFDTHPTITLPDLRERFLYGASFNSDLGDTGGAAAHALTIDEMPAHSHVIQNRGGAAGAVLTNAGYFASVATPVSATTTPTANSGGGLSHNNMPPYMRGYWIIKVLP